MYGFNNRILHINLTVKSVSTLTFPLELYRQFYDGSGISSYILYYNFDIPSPMSPESPLLFISGLLTGTPVPAANKLSVCGRSPQTGIWNEATLGGDFGTELKYAGYDGMIIVGTSLEPVYLWITNENVQILSAGDLWGKETYETHDVLLAKTDPGAKIVSIGPAGEKLSYMASIMAGGTRARAAGRGGMGAVMGLKNLKAIVVKGHNRSIPVADMARLTKSIKTVIPILQENTKLLSQYGTAIGVEPNEFTGDLPIKNFLEGSWKEGAQKICGPAIAESMKVEHKTCRGCPIRCDKVISIDESPFGAIYGRGPEYETLAAFGALCLNNNLLSITRANDLCNRYGIDTISTGATIAFAMECYEEGKITTADTDGIELNWGNWESILKMIEKIAFRQGFGDILADGVKIASEKIGKNCEEMAIHHKGMEMPMHDPRAFYSMTANYATANRGACHLEALSYFVEGGVAIDGLNIPPKPDRRNIEQKAAIAVEMQNYMSVFNPLGLCKFLIRGKIGPPVIAEWLNSVTGWDVDNKELLETGERIFNLKRLYNNKIGITKKDDLNYPKRLLKHDRGEGGAAGMLPDLDTLLNEYYVLRKWDDEGKPMEEILKKLSLSIA